MKYTLALLIALLATPAAFAGLDEGLAAYKAKDYATALKELRTFAEQGSVVAQNALGDMYKFGFDHGVPKNNVEAYKWFTIASVGGDDYASTERDELEKNMTSKKINLAQRLATAWMVKHPAK